MPLDQGFLHPPASARPWVYWFWMDGNVTREGITADLEAMSRVGIGGALLMDVTQGFPPGPVQFGSREWVDLFKYAVTEAGRLGLELSVNNSAGWSGSGGPWISPTFGMQKAVTIQTNLTGPSHFHGRLPKFAGVNEAGKTLAVVAFPSLGGEGGPLPGFPPERTTIDGAGLTDPSKLFDGDSTTSVSIPAPRPGKPQYLQLEFAQPFEAARLTLYGSGRPQTFQGKLQVSNNGQEFRDVRDFSNTGSTLLLLFERTSARFYRLQFTQADSALTRLEFSEVELDPGYRIQWYQSKSGAGPLPSNSKAEPNANVPAFAAVSPEQVLDVTSKMDGDVLNWDVPKGHWTVLRFGCAPLGTENHTSSRGGLGLECDKLSREAIEKHFDSFVGRLTAQAGAATALKATHVDSWEVGFQNCTPNLLNEFQARRGYDPVPYLPIFSGRFVGGSEQSERVLWDVRRTISDLLTENYAGHLAELAHQHGLNLSIEAYASLGQGPFDDLLYAGRADIPMTEFWYGTNDLSKLDLHSMPSAAHVYGKPVVAAEAFTSEPAYAKWQEHPFALKPLADAAFCEGVNRLVFHRFAHQPWTNRAPGMTMGPFGVHYERTQTWWEYSRPWHEYLARCQYLLQRGLFVADVCYLTSEGAFTHPASRDHLVPPLPEGYNYDLTPPDVVINRMSVKNGRLVLPDGMGYDVLVLPDERSMTPNLLRKIKQLVEAGATVVGPRPNRSPSLAGYPQCDDDVRQLAGELWGACDGQKVQVNRLGKGMVIWGQAVSEVLKNKQIGPDFIVRDASRAPGLHYIHRRIGETEVYFVANPNPRPVVAECQFRTSGKWPEFWRPDTGEMGRATIWHQQDGNVEIPLKLDAGGSVFVVFRHSSAGADPVVRILKDGQLDESIMLSTSAKGDLRLLTDQTGTYTVQLNSGRQLKTRISDLPADVAISGNWDLTFPNPSGALEQVTLDRLVSWTADPNDHLKYFSGTATYRKSFKLRPDLLNRNRRFYLSLGTVQVIAELKVNGSEFGVLWKPPFEVDITRAIQEGNNSLEIEVVNLWPNRLIGDEQLPEDCQWQTPTQPDYGYGIAQWPAWLRQGQPSPTGRTTFTTWKHWHKDSALLESGLLGPVALKVFEELTLK